MALAMIYPEVTSISKSLTTSSTHSWEVASTLTASQIMVICEDVLGLPTRIKHWTKKGEPQVYAEYSTRDVSATLFTSLGNRPTRLNVTLVFSHPSDDELAYEVIAQIVREATDMVELVGPHE
jgi:hypothetical protein